MNLLYGRHALIVSCTAKLDLVSVLLITSSS